MRPPAPAFCRLASGFRLLVSGLWLLLILAGCGPHESDVAKGDREQVLHRSIGPDIPSLDPHLTAGVSAYAVLSAVLEGLVSEDPVDLHPVPGVAESWDVSPDGLVYTFHLRSSARWSNGDPVTAGDFAASFQRLLAPALAAENASALYVLHNAEAFNKGSLTDFSQVGIQAIDTHTLQLTLEHPAPQFLAMLNQSVFLPVHLPAIEKYGAATDRANPWARPERFVGNGPFVLTAWKIGQKITVRKSSTYWDATRVRLNEIDFYSFESLDAEERAFRAGQLHLTDALPPSKIDSYRRQQPDVLRIDPYLGVEFYRINVTRPFLNDRRVRQALSLAIDREKIAADLLRGGQLPAHTFTPPDVENYSPPAGAPGDPETARKMLADAGYPHGQGAPPVEILFNTSEGHRSVAEAVQEMWRRELGLEVHLVNQEFKTTLSARRSGDFQILRSVWIGDYPSVASFLDVWTSASGNNYTGWSSPAFDQAIFEADRTSDLAARNALYAKAEKLLLDDAPMIPLYHYAHIFLIQRSVKGWSPTLLDHHPYKYVYLDSH